MNSRCWYIIFVLSVSLGCGISDEEMRLLATKEYERKAANLRQERALICRKAALMIAERRADSIVAALQLNPIRDTLYRPQAPTKPVFIETDSSVLNSKQTVKPIIDSTLFSR